MNGQRDTWSDLNWSGIPAGPRVHSGPQITYLKENGPIHFLEECKELGIKFPKKRNTEEKKPKQTWSINSKNMFTNPLDEVKDVLE